MISNILSGGLTVLIVLLAIKIISLPVKLIFKLLINTACGFLILFIIDVLSVYTGVWVQPTILSALLVGVLGLPGVGLLLIFNWLV